MKRFWLGPGKDETHETFPYPILRGRVWSDCLGRTQLLRAQRQVGTVHSRLTARLTVSNIILLECWGNGPNLNCGHPCYTCRFHRLNNGGAAQYIALSLSWITSEPREVGTRHWRGRSVLG